MDPGLYAAFLSLFSSIYWFPSFSGCDLVSYDDEILELSSYFFATALACK